MNFRQDHNDYFLRYLLFKMLLFLKVTFFVADNRSKIILIALKKM